MIAHRDQAEAAPPRRYCHFVYSDDRNRHITELVSLGDGVCRYVGQAMRMVRTPEGKIAVPYQFEIAAADIDEAFDAMDARAEAAWPEALRIWKQQMNQQVTAAHRQIVLPGGAIGLEDLRRGGRN